MSHGLRQVAIQSAVLLGLAVIGGKATVAQQPAAVPLPRPDSDEWQIISIDQQRVGYGRVHTRNVQDGATAVVRTTQQMEIAFVRFGNPIRMKVWLRIDDTSDGQMRSFRLRIGDAPERQTVVTGEVTGRRLQVKTRVAGQTTSSSIEWNSQIRSPAYELLLYRTRLRQPGDRVHFQMYKPETNSVVDVSLTADARERVRLHDGSERELLRTTLRVPQFPEVQSYIDAQGRVLRTQTDFLGKRLITETVPQELALQEIVGEELDQAVETLIPTDRIARPHQTGKVVYRVTLRSADPSELLPSDDFQKVESIDGRTARVTVRAVQPARESSPSQVDRAYRDPNRFLQVDDPAVRRHTRRAVGNVSDPLEICFRAEQYVHEQLKLKNFSTALASAAEVAKSMEGDCTEHAVLLAAMLRGCGIPTRLVAGVVYVEMKSSPYFAGHMWTEAHVRGRWMPLDATLGARGIGAAHIKLSESSFADDAPIPATIFLPLLKILGNVQIQVLSVD